MWGPAWGPSPSPGQRVERVMALEPSSAMLDEALRAALEANHLHNVTCWPAAWGEADSLRTTSSGRPAAAPIFADILRFLIEAEPLARRAIALVQNAGPGGEKFYLGKLYPLLLGRPLPGARRLPLHPHPSPQSRDLRARPDRRLPVRPAVHDAVRGHRLLDRADAPHGVRPAPQAPRCLGRLEPAGSHLIAPMRRQSAVIWWQTSPKDPA